MGIEWIIETNEVGTTLVKPKFEPNRNKMAMVVHKQADEPVVVNMAMNEALWHFELVKPGLYR